MILTLAAWALVTAWHFVLTDRAAARLLDPRATALDERIFVSALGGVASLSIVLHALAVSVGIGLMSGALGLAAWHLALRWATRRAGASPPIARAALRATPSEALALAVFAGIVLTWVGLAAQSADVLGPDNAHYHMPFAVNLAAGASPFDLPATPHLYPMAGSVVAAWFIVPLGTPQIADLAMALPFVLLVASLHMLFRLATGLSGTAWASWLSIALFSTPMFRMTSLGSADLWFAAAFVALVAAMMLASSRRQRGAIDVVLIGCAAGLLVGSKATGVPAAALIIGVWLAIAGVRRLVDGRGHGWSAGPGTIGVAGLLLIGAGGVWLLRNWIQFGSPIAPSGLAIAGVTVFDGEPFQRSTYLSVLAELETEAFQLWPRTQFFVSQWLGSWFLMALWPIGLFAVDLIARGAPRDRDQVWWARVTLLLVTSLVGAALIWLLRGAPWTGLERSRGLTLRYALPIAALLALTAFAGCFPITRALAWHRRAFFRLAVTAIVMIGAAVIFRTSVSPEVQAGRALPVPGLQAVWFVVALLWVMLVRIGARRRSRFVHAVLALGLIALVGVWVPAVVRHDALTRKQAAETLRREEAAIGTAAAPGIAWRDAFLAVRVAERAVGRACGRQRFYALVRFDEPLALQPPEFGNQVYYAGRDVDAARRAGPIGMCDYIISSTAMADTDKGAALAAALAGERPLRTVASTRDLVILGVDASKPPVRP